MCNDDYLFLAIDIYLSNLNIDDINTKMLQSMQIGKLENVQKKEDDKIVDLKVKGELPTNPQKGGEEYENEQPRQGI